MNVYLWWLNQQECEFLSAQKTAIECLPEYVKEQFSSMCGRPLRGRLWVEKNLDAEFKEKTGKEVAMDDWPNSILGMYLEKSGGIAIRESDVHNLFTLYPGIVTDMQLNKYFPFPTAS